MPHAPRILAFAGSLRKGSYNKSLARFATKALTDAGADATFLDLADYPMPLFDQDIETASGMPEHAARFKKALIEHDGLLIASPEYNSTITAPLKNAIDWATRKQGDEPPLVAFAGKTAAIVSASPGALGGLRGLFHLREILQNIQVHVIPPMHAIAQAHNAFNEQGELTDENHAQKIRGVAQALAEATRRLS